MDVVSEVKRRISAHIPKDDVGVLRNMRAVRSIRPIGTVSHDDIDIRPPVGRTTLKLRKQIERARRMERTRAFYDKMNIDKECVWTHSISDNFEQINYEQLDTELVPNNIYIIHQHPPGITRNHIIGRFIQSDVLNGKINYVFEPYWSRIVRFNVSEPYSEWKNSKEITLSTSFMEKFLDKGDIRVTNPITKKTRYNPYLLVVDKRDIKHDANERYYDIYDISKHDTFGLFRKHLPNKSPEEICKRLPQHRLEMARTFEEIGSKHSGSDDPLSHVMSFLKTGGTRKRTLCRLKFRGRTQKRHHRRRRS